MTTYHVFVYTGDKFGAGTDANVYIVLFGEIDDSGKWLIVFMQYAIEFNYSKFHLIENTGSILLLLPVLCIAVCQ